MLIALDQIDAGHMVRAGVHDRHLRALRAGQALPPLFVRPVVATGRYALVGGTSRYHAMKRHGLTEAECEILHPHGTAPENA